ncbi:MAG: hypothetical protein DWH99_11235 [Planctomycetota bacterium]|nr:MAG: hypothetical protein DWH99_11235 [Planctomycetota bacterium]
MLAITIAHSIKPRKTQAYGPASFFFRSIHPSPRTHRLAPIEEFAKLGQSSVLSRFLSPDPLT